VNSLIVVACDGEEAGLRGAEAFAAAPPVAAASMVVNVNLDMIGRDPDDKLFAVGTLLNPYLKPMVEEVAKTAPVKLLIGHDDPANKTLDDWTRDSDHYALWTALKMPFIYLGVEDESQHHKSTDDYETITYDFYIRAVETSIALIRNFDKNLDLIQKGRPS
jgi:Zn-dependent M28 family amino/carboxypeptidase